MKKRREPPTYNEFPSYKGGHTVLYGKYIWEFCPDHPLRNMWGWVAQHRLVAEDIVGRPLVTEGGPAKQEAAHHIDEDPTNNHPSNIQVMTMREHRSLHTRQKNEERYRHLRNIRPQVARALETMSIRDAAESVGMTHMTLRKHYPDLVAPRKRKSPVRMHAPTEEELAIVSLYAADENLSLADCRKAAQMSDRTILRLCEKMGIQWVRKTRRGRKPRTYRGKPIQRE